MIVVKNMTVLDISLEDLGIIIPGSSVINLTDTFKLHDIVSSTDLKINIKNESIVINDGIKDLSKEEGLQHVTFETVYEDKSDIQKVVDLGESFAYSTTWVEKLRFDLTALEVSNYLLSWSFEIRSNDNTINNYCEARVLINNSNRIATNSWLYAKYQYFSGTDIGQLTGVFSVSIEYRRRGNYQPVYIRNAKISLIKLD